MKANNEHTNSPVWIQLCAKIKDADDKRNRARKLLREEVKMILGKNDMKVIIPKNSKVLNRFIAEAGSQF